MPAKARSYTASELVISGRVTAAEREMFFDVAEALGLDDKASNSAILRAMIAKMHEALPALGSPVAAESTASAADRGGLALDAFAKSSPPSCADLVRALVSAGDLEQLEDVGDLVGDALVELRRGAKPIGKPLSLERVMATTEELIAELAAHGELGFLERLRLAISRDGREAALRGLTVACPVDDCGAPIGGRCSGMVEGYAVRQNLSPHLERVRLAAAK
jgi:hypothetical protein